MGAPETTAATASKKARTSEIPTRTTSKAAYKASRTSDYNQQRHTGQRRGRRERSSGWCWRATELHRHQHPHRSQAQGRSFHQISARLCHERWTLRRDRREDKNLGARGVGREMSTAVQRVHKNPNQTSDGGTLTEIPTQVPRDDASTCSTERLTNQANQFSKQIHLQTLCEDFSKPLRFLDLHCKSPTRAQCVILMLPLSLPCPLTLKKLKFSVDIFQWRLLLVEWTFMPWKSLFRTSADCEHHVYYWSALFSLSAEFPSFPALIAENKCCHRLVSRPGLSLVVCGVALAAAATLDQCRLGAFGNCQSTVIDPLLDKRLPLLLHLIAGHLCRGHHGQPLCSYASQQKAFSQSRVFLVFQVEHSRPHLVLVLWVGLLELCENSLFQTCGQFFTSAGVDTLRQFIPFDGRQ